MGGNKPVCLILVDDELDKVVTLDFTTVVVKLSSGTLLVRVIIIILQ